MPSPRRSGTKSAIAALLWFSWAVGFAGATTSTSLHGTHAHNSSHTGDHHPTYENTYSRLRHAGSSTASSSSLGDPSHDGLLNDLQEIVLFLSQKMDDSDARIRSLEEAVKSQEATIRNLETEVSDASSFHRYLQIADRECLPRFRDTPLGPRCDFEQVTRFQNRTFFNEEAVFNENVEFDPDANCMPVFNTTTRMCRYNNNFTFDEGTINFDRDVRFTDTVKFDDNASFRDHVEMRNDVDFNGGKGTVTFDKDVKFTEDVLIRNDNHEIEFKLEDKVKAKFYQDETFEVDTDTTFYQDVDLKKDLEVDGTLRVKKKSKLDDLELEGYLWVDGYTRLESTLWVKEHTTLKEKLKIESGGLEVSNHGAKITGTTELNGDLKLYGNGFVDQGFSVDGTLTASSVLIEPTNSITRNLEVQMHPVPHPTPAPAPSPKLQVRGDADITGVLFAEKIRSNDIDGDNTRNDIDELIRLLKAEFRDDTLVFGDVRVVNNFVEEPVITESRMVDLMRSATLTVAKLVANDAVIGGKPVPGTDDAVTSQQIVGLLKNQNLDVNSVTSNGATIGGRSYPHTDSPDGNNDMTGDEIVDKLRGKSLVDLVSVTSATLATTTASIGGELYPQSSAPGSVDIDDLVARLQLYEGTVTIPYLSSVHLDMINAIRQDMTIIPARIQVDGTDVALVTDIQRLDNKIDSSDGRTDNNGGMTQDEIVQALAGASLSVSSLDASSIQQSFSEVATIDDVNQMVGEAALAADNGSAAATCTCDASTIEAVVTPDFVRASIDDSYVGSLGFVTNDDISGLGGGGSCTCAGSDIQANVDQSFLESLGVSFATGEPQGCTCSAEDIQNVVDDSYIQSVMGGGADATCTCSADDISSVVDYNYVAGLGFLDEVPEVSDCACDIEGVVTKDYISQFGFLDSCPCDTFVYEP